MQPKYFMYNGIQVRKVFGKLIIVRLSVKC